MWWQLQMKRVLVLGADGMLGHQLFTGLGPGFDVVGSIRGVAEAVAMPQGFEPAALLTNRDLRDSVVLHRTIEEADPEIVVNAVGIVKQRPASEDVLQSLEVNSVLPHRLAGLCGERGVRLIQISTDCVFAGTRGNYTESDAPDAADVYGRTKQLGEVSGPGCLTLRTSIIGLELARFRSLVEWFLAQSGTVTGYTRAIFSGLTTAELTRVIGTVLSEHPGLNGIYHVASAPISKHDLLARLATLLQRPVRIVPDDSLRIDRSLDGSRFRAATGIDVACWDRMLGDLAQSIRQRSG